MDLNSQLPLILDAYYLTQKEPLATTETEAMDPLAIPANTSDGPISFSTQSHDDDDVKIADTSKEADKLPSTESLRSAEGYEVLDREGKPRPFKTLYSGSDSTSRVLIIFIRHFFCGVSS